MLWEPVALILDTKNVALPQWNKFKYVCYTLIMQVGNLFADPFICRKGDV